MAEIDLTPPLATRLAYQNSQMATGTYFQGGSQVFSHLVSPPLGGVIAEITSDNEAFAAGAVTPWAELPGFAYLACENRDYMRDAADSASGNHALPAAPAT